MTDYKPIIIIDAFMRNERCKRFFKDTVKRIGELNIPIMLITNTTVDDEIQSIVQYIIYDKENRLFDDKKFEHTDYINNWVESPDFRFEILYKGFQRHGLSVLCNLYHAIHMAKDLGYTHFYRFEYDILLTDDAMTYLKNCYSYCIENNKRGIFAVSSDIFISFQFWFCELNLLCDIFPKLNNEDDYIDSMSIIERSKIKSVAAERYVYFLLEKYDLVKDVKMLSVQEFDEYFNGSTFNIVKTDADLDEQFVDGFYSGPLQIVSKDNVLNKDTIAIFTWNNVTEEKNTSVINIKNRVSNYDINHTVVGANAWEYRLVDIYESTEVTIKMNGHYEKKFTINKNNVGDLFGKMNIKK